MLFVDAKSDDRTIFGVLLIDGLRNGMNLKNESYRGCISVTVVTAEKLVLNF